MSGEMIEVSQAALLRYDIFMINAIREAIGDGDIASVRTLLIEYQTELGIDLTFQGFADELKNLPGAYASPAGCLFIALIGDQAAGCVGLRQFDQASCEMKRLYVRPEFRKAKLGIELARHVIVKARQLGYQRMLLDTLPTMQRAQRMYEQIGFRDVAPYRHNPIAGTRFLSLDLGSAS